MECLNWMVCCFNCGLLLVCTLDWLVVFFVWVVLLNLFCCFMLLKTVGIVFYWMVGL